MTVIMPKNVKEERLRWVLPIVSKKVKLKGAAIVCPHSKRTLERWVSAYKLLGEAGLEPKSTRPKTNPKDMPIALKEKIIAIRKDSGKSAIKIHWQLEKAGIIIHERTIGKYLKTEGLTRRYRIRKVQYKYIKAQLQPGDLLEIDVKYVPKRFDGKQYFQYTAIDCASRWRHLEVYDDQNNTSIIQFLHVVIARFPYPIKAIKTDNHSTFTNRYTGYQKSEDPRNPRLHPLDLECQKLGIEHYLIDPGKPAQNGKVERSHRSDQEQVYNRFIFRTVNHLKLKLRLWNMYYNDLEHCGLGGKTPNEMLQLYHH
jgi:transposase InsO family protein